MLSTKTRRITHYFLHDFVISFKIKCNYIIRLILLSSRSHWWLPSPRENRPSWYHCCCSMGICFDCANFIHIHSHDGLPGTHRCFTDCDTECKLHGKTSRSTLYSWQHTLSMNFAEALLIPVVLCCQEHVKSLLHDAQCFLLWKVKIHQITMP